MDCLKRLRVRNICLVLEYEGKKFNGFQTQPNENVITVQCEIEKAIQKVTGTETRLYGSGRTDTGVSAEEQYANFFTDFDIAQEKFRLAINSYLPPEISINKSFEVPENFNARYSAIKRTYRYRILNSPTRSALRRNSVFKLWPELNFEVMEEAWHTLSGTHDFSAFCKTNSDRKIMTCTIFDTDAYKYNDEMIFIITGDTFLRGMVRLLIGTLINIGKEKLKPEDLMKIVDKKERNNMSFSAGAEGLSLIKIEYPESAFLFNNKL